MFADRMQKELTSLSLSSMKVCVVLFQLLSVGLGADANSWTLAPAAVSSQVLLMTVVSVSH
jgi:hypothetical protein